MTVPVRMLMGVGNDMNGDDGVGPYIARRLAGTEWISVDCSTVPENFTSLVRRIRPDVLVIVDCADLGLKPGEFRIVPVDRLTRLALSTHSIPMEILIRHLKDLAGEVLFIGIQPERTGFDEPISDAVKRAAGRLISLLTYHPDDVKCLQSL